MGRYYWDKKEEADGLKRVNVSFLKKYGYFDNGWHSGMITFSRNGQETDRVGIQSSINESEDFIKLNYTQIYNYTNEKKDFDYKVQLTSTSCTYGGKRYWFICPLITNGRYCGRRVGVLYKNGDYFGCRHCNNLTYNSKNLSGIFKNMGQIISAPDLEKLESEVKHEYYAGKMTRKYKSLLKKREKFINQLAVVSDGLKL